MAAIVYIITKPSTIDLFVLFLIIISPITTTNAAGGDDSDALLKLKSSFVDPFDALKSWQQGTKACQKGSKWVGVICSKNNVFGLRLEKMNLSGTIDIDALFQIPGLRTISFMSNYFSGPIPGFNKLSGLRTLFLSENQFSGKISSDYFDHMLLLKKVWLSQNQFTGEIPYSLTECQHLIELHLENNQFSGKIPELKQPSLVSLDLSNNSLSGEIPPVLKKFNTHAFEHNPELCGEKIGTPCLEKKVYNNVHPGVNTDDEQTTIGIWISIPVVAILLLMIALRVILWRKQKKIDASDKEMLATESLVSRSSKRDIELRQSSKSSSRRGGGSSNGKRCGDLVIVNDEKGKFGLTDLMGAAAEVLGNGALGSSFKAMMSNGLTVVVKRVKDMSRIEKDAFDSEIRCLCRLKHRNVLPPLAYNYLKDEKLLISEYMPNGSLLYLLHGDKGLPHADLTWPIRLKIIQGIARGMGYLHNELAHLDLPHGDLKSSNVLLSQYYEPLLVDYGLSSLISTDQATEALFAYKSPEAIQQHNVSPKCDVFCLGIIILELLTGKFPSQYLSNGKGGTDIVQWARSAISDGLETELFDPEIVSTNNSPDEMHQLLQIAAACTEPNPDQRLDIGEAIRRIEDIQV